MSQKSSVPQATKFVSQALKRHSRYGDWRAVGDQPRTATSCEPLSSASVTPRQIVEEWVAELRRDHLWGIDDPLFPSTAIGQDSDRRFAATGLARTHWASAAAVQKIFKHSFEAIGLHGFNPHNFRHALAVLGEKICRTLEKFFCLM
jgi:hypothetical protein